MGTATGFSVPSSVYHRSSNPHAASSSKVPAKVDAVRQELLRWHYMPDRSKVIPTALLYKQPYGPVASSEPYKSLVWMPELDLLNDSAVMHPFLTMLRRTSDSEMVLLGAGSAQKEAILMHQIMSGSSHRCDIQLIDASRDACIEASNHLAAVLVGTSRYTISTDTFGMEFADGFQRLQHHRASNGFQRKPCTYLYLGGTFNNYAPRFPAINHLNSVMHHLNTTGSKPDHLVLGIQELTPTTSIPDLEAAYNTAETHDWAMGLIPTLNTEYNMEIDPDDMERECVFVHSIDNSGIAGLVSSFVPKRDFTSPMMSNPTLVNKPPYIVRFKQGDRVRFEVSARPTRNQFMILAQEPGYRIKKVVSNPGRDAALYLF